MLNERFRSDAKPFFFLWDMKLHPSLTSNLASPPTPLRKERGVITTVGWIFLVGYYYSMESITTQYQTLTTQPHPQLSLTLNPSPKGEGSDYQCRVNILSSIAIQRNPSPPNIKHLSPNI